MPIKNLADLLLERFGVRTRAVENPKTTSVGTTAVEILSNNPRRLGAVIINLSTNTVYLGLSQDVSSSKGILLTPNGGSFALVWDEDFQMTAWAWWAVSSGASSSIYTIEVVVY